jgi:TolB-like protein
MTEDSGNPTSLGHDVFVSYASQDAAVANSIVENLESQGLKCWLAPRNVKPGAQYADAIVRAINEAKAVVLVMSGNAVGSSHVGKEIERASSKRKPIIAFRIDTAPLNHALEYFLSESQWIDVPAIGMPAALGKLKEAVGQGSATSSQVILGRRAGGVVKRLGAAAAVLVAVGVVLGAGWHYWSSSHKTSPPVASPITDKSIAVLPFVDMSEKKDQEYFADGMAEEIIDLLAKVPGLHVPARTSSFYFKGKSTKIPDIARELGVAQILEGSIRRSGDRIRVTAQLVRADTGYHLWSETYDRPLDDVFKVQDNIANAVVQRLQISLMGGPLTRQQGGTENLEAYQLYIHARGEYFAHSKQSVEASREHLERATKLDPNFSLAWCMLAKAVQELALFRTMPRTDGFELSREYANHALELTPDLSDARLALAYIYRTYDWDWRGAQEEVRRVLADDPTNPLALRLAGQISATIGRFDDAERQLRSALIRDPLDTITNWNLATILYRAGRLADAEAQYRKLLELAPDFVWTRHYLAKTLLVEGKPETALAIMEQEGDETERVVMLPLLLWGTGQQAEADAALKTLITRFADSEAYSVAMSYAQRGHYDLAMQWLERAYKQKEEETFIEIVGEPLFNNLAIDPRYKVFLKKMNLPSD